MQPAQHGSGRFRGNERFQIVRALGEGAGGEVYEAYDRNNAVGVAIKTLRELAPEHLLLLKREFRSLQDIAHPNLVRLGELFEEQGRWFFTMELVRGQPFTDYVRVDGVVEEARLRSALAQLVRGLNALHGAHKVHCDVKPSNVLVDANGRTVLLDFGVVADARAEHGPGMQGTVAYMAPEQILGDAVAPHADLYAVGVMLYECLTGRLPFEGNGDDVIEAKLLAEAKAPSELATNVPSDLDQLCSALLSSEPSQRPSAAAVLNILEPNKRSSLETMGGDDLFVGRRRELAVLQTAFDVSACATVLLRGESGVGKSHLVAHFLQTLRHQTPDLIVLEGRCYEREQVSYKGIDTIVDGVVRVLEQLSPAELARVTPTNAHLLRRAFPVLGEVLKTERELEELLVPQELRARIFAALRELMSSLAERQRVVVVIDDIQWSNTDSLALLSALLQPPGAPKILWLLMERTGSSVGEQLQRANAITALDIGRLSTADAQDLAQQILATHPALSANVANDVVREAGGHPLFLSELLRMRGPQRGRALKLDDVLWERVSELSERERAITCTLAVAGAPIPRAVLEHAVGVSKGELFQLMGTLQVDKLVRSIGGEGSDSVAIFHDRVRESITANLDAFASAAIHEKLATAMEHVAGIGLEQLSYHWEHAGNRERAADYSERAAEQAWTSLAFERAAQSLTKLLELRPVEGEERTQLELRMAQAWSNAGHGAKAAQVRLTLASRVAGVVGVEQRMHASGELLMGGHYSEGRALLREVLRDLDLPYPSSRKRALLGFIGRRIQLRIRGTKSVLKRPEEIDVLARVRTDACWAGMNGLNLLDSIYGNYFSVLHTLYALRLGEPRRVLATLVMDSLVGGARDPKHSHRMLTDARKIADQLGDVQAQAMLQCGYGGTAYFWGEWKRAVPALVLTEQLLRDHCVGVTYLMNTARFMLYRCLSIRGDLQEMRARIPRVLREARERSDRYMLVNIRTTQTIVDCADDDEDIAMEHIEEATRGLPSDSFHVQHYLCLSSRAQALSYFERPHEALKLFQDAWPALKASLLLRVNLISAFVHDGFARAALATAAAQPARAAELLPVVKMCVRALQGLKYPWPRAFISLILAGEAALTQKREAQIAHLKQALVEATTHGMDLHHAAASIALGSLQSGPEAKTLHDGGVRFMREQGVVNPERMTALLAPASYASMPRLPG